MLNNRSITKSSLGAVVALAICLVSQTAKAGYFEDHNWYYGLDMGSLETKFKQNYGENFFPDSVFDASLYFGRMANKKFGFEIGFNGSAKEYDYIYHGAGASFPGTFSPNLPGEWQQWDNSISVSSIFAGVNWYRSILESDSLGFFVFCGAEYTKMEPIAELFDDDLPGIPDGFTRTFTKRRLVPLIKLGLNMNFTQHWGCRAVYAWRYYEIFNPMKSLEAPERASELQMKNSNAYYFGIYYRF